MKVVLLIPTFNERANIVKLSGQIRQARRKIKDWTIEVLVVDDNSPDRTWEVVAKASKKDKTIHLLWRKKREGLGAAYLSGMREAFGKMQAQVVLVMDADLSHNPSHISAFLQKVDDGADLVIGSRYIKGGSIPRTWAPHRKFLSIFGNKIVSIVLGRRGVNDWTSGYRAVKRSVFEKIYPQISKSRGLRGYTFNVAFAYWAHVLGFKIVEVPIKFRDRTSGRSKLGFEYLVHTPTFILKTRISEVLRSIVKP